MLRYLTALLAVVALAAGADAADKKLTIRWHGQSFFEIVSSDGTTIVLDPHAIENFGRQSVKADIVVCSHPHSDHTHVEVVEGKPKVLYGVKDEKGDGKKFDWNAIDQTVKDVKIRTLGTFHDQMNGMQRGLNTIFILEFDGLKIAHLGDLGHTLSDAQLKKLGEVDVLFVPVGGVYTLNGEDAAIVVKQIKPRRYVIPMHYGTAVYDDVLPVDEFLDNSKKEAIKKYKTNELVIDPSAKQPAEPEIAVLHWDSGKDK